MKIIKKGNLKACNHPIRFNCKNCGCIFVANNAEYRHRMAQTNDEYYSCICPCCKREVCQAPRGKSKQQ